MAAQNTAFSGEPLQPVDGSPDPFFRLDATAQAALVKSRQVSALDLVEAAIARIERLNPVVNAVIHQKFEQAREQARSGRWNPEAHFGGVPYLIKDLSDTKGFPLEFGSRLFAGNHAKRDLGAVERAREAGLIFLGKSITPEFGLLGTTEPLLCGATRNPWDLSRHAGGSSGGAAAAVASGMLPMAHGSDGGGSIRIPASACGLVGLKPSRGRLYRVKGEDRELPADIACRLGLSRSVRDTAGLLNLSENRGSKAPLKPLGLISGPTNRKYRIAWSTRTVLGTEAHPDVAAAIHQTVDLCRSLGHELVEATSPIEGPDFIEHFMGLWSNMGYQLVKNARLIGLLQRKWVRAEKVLEPWTLGLARWFASREKARPGVLRRSRAYIRQLEQDYDDFFSGFDLELTPVLRTPPLRLGLQSPELDFDTLFERITDYAAYTSQHNATGNPAISLPLFTCTEGLPVGSQFIASKGREDQLLDIAYQLEGANPWADRWAPFSARYM